ncbi:MAG: hypothetical protein KKC76_15640 [Proteobacteria bacterium]|nr:hypothetical protein [Pseudomonadota bacterium]MBU4294541.1 hypothetical protein [Pseudomonadota bacterium]MCG2747077.1 hypothetical protein [Desulfobulbaceae bacterium]
MALINIDTAIKRVLLLVGKIEPPRGVEILTYKRNRGVSIIRLAEDSFLVRERGYEEHEMQVSFTDLARVLKSMAKREFPRSRQVRIYQLEGPDFLDQERKRI